MSDRPQRGQRGRGYSQGRGDFMQSRGIGRGRNRGSAGGQGQDRGGYSRGDDDGRRGQNRAENNERGGYSSAGAGRRNVPPEIFPFPAEDSMEPRLSSEEQDGLIERLKTLSPGANRVLRPGWGTLGKEINIRANFFVVKYQPKTVLYDYALTFKPDCKAQAIKARLLELIEKNELSPFLKEIVHGRAQRIISRSPLTLRFPFSIQKSLNEQNEDGAGNGSPIYTIVIKQPVELRTNDLDE